MDVGNQWFLSENDLQNIGFPHHSTSIGVIAGGYSFDLFCWPLLTHISHCFTMTQQEYFASSLSPKWSQSSGSL